jgi:hypothetical protein
MSKVRTYNGQDGSSPDGLFFHSFSGRPVDQYDFPRGDPRGSIGDVFVLTVRAEVVKVVEDEIKDGRRQTIGFKVIDSKIGNIVAKADNRDPNQTSIDDVTDEGGDYGDYGDYAPPVAEVLGDQGDEPADDTETADGTIVAGDFGRPAFSSD